jgi:hypothetical protein
MMRGLMITGAPHVKPNNMAHGFNSSPQTGAAGKQDLSEADIEAFVQAIFGDSAEPFLREAVARADGRFRKRLFEAARAGEGVDQRQIVESSPVRPTSIVFSNVSCRTSKPAGRRLARCKLSHIATSTEV